MILDSFRQDVRVGLRMLFKEKAFCFLAVLVLGLGIGGATTQFTVVNAIMLRGFSFPHPEQLVGIGLIDPKATDVRTDMATAYHFMGQTDRALEEYDQVLKVDSKHANALFNTGMVKWQDKQDMKGAVAAMVHAGAALIETGSRETYVYGSVIENDDFAVYKAQPRATKPEPILPFGTVGSWIGHMWAVDANNQIVVPPIVGTIVYLPAAPTGGAIFVRVEHQGESESISQLDGSGTELIGLEVSDQFRMNTGTLYAGDVAFVPLSFVFWDAAGNRLADVSAYAGQMLPVGDRRVARITAARGGGFASVIDNRSGDATFIPSQ